MTTSQSAPNRTTTPARGRPRAMYVGLALTVIGVLAPLVDVATVDTLSAHVRAAYPNWAPDLIQADRNAILVFLVVTGVLGIAVWSWTIWAVTVRKTWARLASTVAFAVGTLLALTALTMSGAHYDTIVPPAYGTLNLLPCAAGLVAVVTLWRRRAIPAGVQNGRP